MLAEAEQFVRQHDHLHYLPEVTDLQVRALLHQGDLSQASDLAETRQLAVGRARVYLARGDPGSALAALEPARQQAEAKGWESERLPVILLQVRALYARARKAHSSIERALYLLSDALALAEPGNLIRIFLDEGPPMARLLDAAATRGVGGQYAARLLAAFPADEPEQPIPSQKQAAASELIEPLSERELEVLQLIAKGLTNPEIAAKLFLALNTVKVHTRNIYGKLGVHSRTQATARARALGVLSST
jgi:LuxR family maltose regulon positive regulatory protein